jgi:SAM-dependent methyltransferase
MRSRDGVIGTVDPALAHLRALFPAGSSSSSRSG